MSDPSVASELAGLLALGLATWALHRATFGRSLEARLRRFLATAEGRSRLYSAASEAEHGR